VPDNPTLPWNSETPPGWRASVNAWRWHPTGGGDWAKSGSCPRCEHEITIQEGTFEANAVEMSEDSRFALEVVPEAAEQADETMTFARCNCGEPHSGRPGELAHGCGQWANIDPPPDDE
jgi:hypothetical protein